MLPGMFGVLPDQTQRQIMLSGRVGQWTRGGVLFHPEEAAHTLYLVTKGNIRLYRIGKKSREVTIAVHSVGDLLGAGALLQGKSYGAFAEAMDECEAMLFSQEALQQLKKDVPALSVILTEQVIKQTQSIHKRLTGLVFLEVSQRLASTLLQLAEREGDWPANGNLPLRERVSHQDLAHAVGSTRETITKLLGEFRERGLLDLGYRRIILLNKIELEKAAK